MEGVIRKVPVRCRPDSIPLTDVVVACLTSKNAPEAEMPTTTHVIEPKVATQVFRCTSCRRKLPDGQFAFVGSATRNGREVSLLSPFCLRCRRQRRGCHTSHPDYNPELDAYWSSKHTATKQGARERRIEYALSKDDLLGKYLEQGGICALSGVRMNPYGRKEKRPSVDRIDSNGAYTLDNIQIVMTIVNLMKSDLPSDIFIEMCGQIARNNNVL